MNGFKNKMLNKLMCILLSMSFILSGIMIPKLNAAAYVNNYTYYWDDHEQKFSWGNGWEPENGVLKAGRTLEVYGATLYIDGEATEGFAFYNGAYDYIVEVNGATVNVMAFPNSHIWEKYAADDTFIMAVCKNEGHEHYANVYAFDPNYTGEYNEYNMYRIKYGDKISIPLKQMTLYNKQFTDVPLPTCEIKYYTDENCTKLTTVGKDGSGADEPGGAPRYNGEYWVTATVVNKDNSKAEIKACFSIAFTDTTLEDDYTPGWNTVDGQRKYYENGAFVKGIKQIVSKIYYFGQDGNMCSSQLVNYYGSIYYVDENGIAIKNEWKTEGEATYYFGSDCKAVKNNWQTVDGNEKYLGSDGKMLVNTTKTIDGVDYKFDSDGVATAVAKDPEETTKKGWLQENGKWYYYLEDGSKATGWISNKNEWYYLNSQGEMTTGWQKVSGKWYYFNNSGVMTTGWQKISSKWYYFNNGGAMTTGWQKISGVWYYFNDGGAMLTGWQKISSKWYYFNGAGAMLTGWQKISNKWYYFNGGAMVTGWQKISSKWYYFKSGVMVTGTQTIGGKTYTFNASGVWVK